MTFGKALELLKAGAVVRRKDWTTMWLVFIPGNTRKLTLDSPYGQALSIQKQAETYITINPHIDIYTADGCMQPGWTPTQADMLAGDWMPLEPH